MPKKMKNCWRFAMIEFVIGKKMYCKDGRIILNCMSIPEGISAVLIIKPDKLTLVADYEIRQHNRLKLSKE